MSLVQKQRSVQADWLQVHAEIRRHPDRARAESLVAEAASRVADRIKLARHPAFGWSGGKDSLALEVVCREAGIHDAVLVISGLEYPAFLAWATSNMPWGLTVECRSNLDYEWLAAHPEMLFPADANTAGRWFANVQHAGQRAYCKREHVDILLIGRRRADGNFLGGEGPYGHEYEDKDGFTRYSPISSWSHEDVLQVLTVYNQDLPPNYSWPRGFRVGTGPWPARQWTKSQADGWREVLEIDPSIPPVAAAWGIPGAAECAA